MPRVGEVDIAPWDRRPRLPVASAYLNVEEGSTVYFSAFLKHAPQKSPGQPVKPTILAISTLRLGIDRPLLFYASVSTESISLDTGVIPLPSRAPYSRLVQVRSPERSFVAAKLPRPDRIVRRDLGSHGFLPRGLVEKAATSKGCEPPASITRYGVWRLDFGIDQERVLTRVAGFTFILPVDQTMLPISGPFAPSSANMSAVFRSAPKGRKISIHAFEIANTIVKGSNLIKYLSKQRIRHLKEGVLRSEGVCRLISEDYSQLSILIEDDIREDLRRFLIEVARFGDLCEDRQWHNLSRYFCRGDSPLPSNNSSEEAPPSMHYLIRLAQHTRVLHEEMLALDRLEHAYYVAAIPVRKQIDAIKNQRGVVKVLKNKSLWSKSMDDIVEKLVEIVDFMHLQIKEAFLKSHANAEQSSGELHIAINLTKTLGATGLALHYAHVILQLKALALASPAVPQNAREALYQALPPGIKAALRTQLRIPDKDQTMSQAGVRAEMNRVLRWLVPAAESTRRYHVNGVFGEWEMKGIEGIDVDEANWLEQESRISVSFMLAHADAKVSKVETLYYADKERTEGYIIGLVLALHRLVSPAED
ncbi:Receptor-like serine/threonine-protein kinase SD1-6 [Hordeum vulgare]|nr:Receptor-like serine/threonine-protein kinase SD1-6 [Hordeum vulgare]